MSGIALSVVWLTPENFAAHRRLDPVGLPATFDEWLRSAESAVAQLALAGQEFERITIDPHELAAWCAAEGMKVDGAARAAFVVHKHETILRRRSKDDFLSSSSISGNSRD